MRAPVISIMKRSVIFKSQLVPFRHLGPRAGTVGRLRVHRLRQNRRRRQEVPRIASENRPSKMKGGNETEGFCFK